MPASVAVEDLVEKAAATSTLFTEAIEPEIPVASEVESGEHAESPALTS